MKISEIMLSEMSINIDRLKSRVGPAITIQIRTGNKGLGPSGRAEHPPPHIHVIIPPDKDVPVEISTAEVMVEKETRGSLSAIQYSQVVQFLDYYGREDLANIFNQALNGMDPEPLFRKLKAQKLLPPK